MRFIDPPTERKRGRKPGFKMLAGGSLGAAAAPVMTGTERVRRHRSKRAREKIENIAVLDMETDPFDAAVELRIAPFLAVLYTDQYGELVIWEEDESVFVEQVIAAIEALPDRFTIYAHNGGKFDFLFLLYKIRGPVSFKGRGIMAAQIGRHELRDSFHIIPERLANWQKDKFDYEKLRKGARAGNRAEIVKYCINDCRYLLDIVKAAVERFGLKLTIGQMAMAEVKKAGYKVPKLDDSSDAYLREFLYGGRVECLRGRGEFSGAYRLFDVNSLYPHCMAVFQHPVGSWSDYKLRFGAPGEATIFIDLECDNDGALIGKTDDGETTARIRHGRFRTTIWEYNVARRFNLIRNVKINLCVDCGIRSDFSRFVLPLYDNRLRTKSELDRMKNAGAENSPAFFDMKKDDMFYKFLLNNAYGKYAINPRRFKEHYLTGPDEQPPLSWFKSINKIGDPNERAIYQSAVFESERYWIWAKPNPGLRFNNVGVAASITGAARAILLEALQLAKEPIYCDTDSIICRDLPGVSISKTELGAWDLEDEFTRVIIAGKKLYAVEHAKSKARLPEPIADGLDPRYTVKSKGTAGLTWADLDCMLHGGAFKVRNRAPTFDRYGNQYYVSRTIRATAPILEAT